MKQKEIAKWLKGICIILAVMGIFFFGLIVPVLASRCKEIYPDAHFLFWPGLIGSWIIGIICYIILYQFWKVCIQIGKDNSFSLENAKSFVIISKLAVAISVICFCGLLFMGIHSWLHPGFMLLMICIILIGIAMAVLAAALSHLILKAYEIKKESELTI